MANTSKFIQILVAPAQRPEGKPMLMALDDVGQIWGWDRSSGFWKRWEWDRYPLEDDGSINDEDFLGYW
jgi:hypothetical protein